MKKVIISANKCKGQSSTQILGYYLRTDPNQVDLQGFSADQATDLKSKIEATGRKVTITR